MSVRRPREHSANTDRSAPRSRHVDKFDFEAYIVGRMADVLGAFEQAVLVAIVRLRDDAYGRAILKEVQARLGRDVAAGAAHSTLERLEKKGLLSSRLGTGTPVRSGRARRYYQLRPRGIRALNNARAAMHAVWRGLTWPVKA